MAVARLNFLISERSNSAGQVDVFLYSAKRQNILASLETLAQNLSRDIYQAVLSVTGETTNLIAEVTPSWSKMKIGILGCPLLRSRRGLERLC